MPCEGLRADRLTRGMIESPRAVAQSVLLSVSLSLAVKLLQLQRSAEASHHRSSAPAKYVRDTKAVV